jgi:hypothetical protein
MRVLLCLLFLRLTAAEEPKEDGGTTPIQKVITMLEDLQVETINEGKAEAKTYDTFACFCKDQSIAKQDEITDGQDAVNDLTATINTLLSDRADVDLEIQELNEELEGIAGFVENKTAARKAAHENFLKLHEEINTGYSNLNGVIKELKAKMDAVSLVSIKTQLVKYMALIQRAPEEYSFQGDAILETVKDLKGDFKVSKSNLEDQEHKEKTDFDKLMLKKKHEREDAETSMKDAKQVRGQKNAAIAKNQRDLTTTQAVLTDDQQYIKELSAKCTEKAELWTQRSKMRADELTAISTALTIISGTVKEKGELLQVKAPVRATNAPVKSAELLQEEDEAIDGDEVDDILDAGASFVQVEPPRTALKKVAALSSVTQHQNLRASSQQEGVLKDQVLALLKSKSAELKSTTLASLASSIASASGADPFVKIKKLIQELVERLLQEAADEANHKGWCDKEIGKAKQGRDMKAGDIKALNQQMATDEAKRDKLTEEIALLTTEIAELSDSLSKTTKMRNDEKAENEATVTEAKEGLEAIEEAIDVLSKFYKTAEKAAAASLVQRTDDGWTSKASGVDEDAPDAGFDEKNKGGQSASTGILGMMDVIKSDFERTISETEKQEKQAAREFLEFETTTKVSLGTKKVGKSAKEAELTETKADLTEAKDSMLEKQGALDKTIQELIELQPACVDTGMSYQERVAKREAEIESLKQALCILGTEGPVQTEPGC